MRSLEIGIVLLFPLALERLSSLVHQYSFSDVTSPIGAPYSAGLPVRLCDTITYQQLTQVLTPVAPLVNDNRPVKDKSSEIVHETLEKNIGWFSYREQRRRKMNEILVELDQHMRLTGLCTLTAF